MPRVKKGEYTIPELLEFNKNGDIHARDKLIEHFMPMSEQIASEYFNLGIEKEDIISSAYEGLIIGIEKLKKINHNNYIYVIRRYIEQTIENSIISKYSLNDYTYLKGKIIKVLKAKRDLIKKYHRYPTVNEIKEEANITLEETIKILNLLKINKYIDLKNMTLTEEKEVINSVLDLEYALIKEYIILNFQEIINKLNLTEREKELLGLYLAPKELAAYRILKISRPRVKEIKNSIIKKIRQNANIMSLFEGISEEHERKWIDTELRYSLKTKSK